jgi:hypothetical protein
MSESGKPNLPDSVDAQVGHLKVVIIKNGAVQVCACHETVI